jgi:hypothetical protein
MSHPHSFQPLEVPLMALNKSSHDAQRTYRVYTSPDEFVSIEAGAAFEAIEKSGIKHPMKVLSDPQLVHCIFEEEMLKSNGIELIGGLVEPALGGAAPLLAKPKDKSDDLIIVPEAAQPEGAQPEEASEQQQEGSDIPPAAAEHSASPDGANLS